MSQRPITEAERQAMDRLIRCARSFVATADEFWPEYPGAIVEPLQDLGLALERLPTDDAPLDDFPAPLLPDYVA